MYRKIDEETIGLLLETGIDEFAEHGLDRANINTIAKKTGISVGVIYKYYKDKEHFFLACVRHALKILDQVLGEAADDEKDVMASLRLLVHEVIRMAEEHRSYFVMYNEITSGGCRRYAPELAREIESKSAEFYRSLLQKAEKEKTVQITGDPRMFAFFIDNMLMMLHFSYSCEYYRERMKIYLGDEIFGSGEEVEGYCVRFLANALGIFGNDGPLPEGAGSSMGSQGV